MVRKKHFPYEKEKFVENLSVIMGLGLGLGLGLVIMNG